MKALTLAVVFAFAATTGATGPFDDAYVRAMEASERCENAWFRWQKQSALDDLNRISTEVIMAMPHTWPAAELAKEKSMEVSRALMRCIRLTYPGESVPILDWE